VVLFPETQKVLEDAKKQCEAFNNYVECLDRKVLAFQKKKVEVFQEKGELKEEHRKEFLKGINERKRLLLLEKRNIDVDPSSSRWAEEDYAEMKELKRKLEPSEKRITEIKQRIETLKFAETKKALFHKVDIAQSMYESVVWLLVKASLFEEAHSAQEDLRLERIQEMKNKDTPNCKYSPQHEGYFLPEEKDLWKTLAEAEFKRRQQKYYENLEKIQNKRKEDQEKEEWRRKMKLYKQWEEDKRNEQ
jgi:hypothetical protein